MNPARIWTFGSVVAVVAIIAGAVVLGVQPQLAAASAADASAAQLKAQNGTTQIELAGLSRLAATQTTLEATNSKLGSAITGSLRLSTFSQQVRDAAALDGVEIVSLDPATATAYNPDSTSAIGTSSTSSGKTPAVTPGVFGKTDPLVTASNFSLIPITITVTGTEAAAVQFASDVQHLKRLFAVDTVGYTEGSSDGTPPTTTISGSIYALKN